MSSSVLNQWAIVINKIAWMENVPPPAQRKLSFSLAWIFHAQFEFANFPSQSSSWEGQGKRKLGGIPSNLLNGMGLPQI